MTMVAPLSPLSPNAASSVSAKAPTVAAVSPDVLDAARQFESIFARKLLSALESTGKMSGKKDAGSGIYGSMITASMADAVTQGDGLGLSGLIVEALSGRIKAPNESLDRPTGTEGIPE